MTRCRPNTSRISAQIAAALLAASALTGAGCSNGEVGVPSATPHRIDERRGAFDGIVLGSPESRVVRRFGPDQGEPNGPNTPLDVDGFESGAPGTYRPPRTPTPHDRRETLRYPGISISTFNRRVYVLMSSLQQTTSRRGVGVGDQLSDVRRAYPELACGAATDDFGKDTFPYCTAEVHPGRFLYFGGDPVGTVAIGKVALSGG